VSLTISSAISGTRRVRRSTVAEQGNFALHVGVIKPVSTGVRENDHLTGYRPSTIQLAMTIPRVILMYWMHSV
jgi:hypothetical protein